MPTFTGSISGSGHVCETTGNRETGINANLYAPGVGAVHVSLSRNRTNADGTPETTAIVYLIQDHDGHGTHAAVYEGPVNALQNRARTVPATVAGSPEAVRIVEALDEFARSIEDLGWAHRMRSRLQQFRGRLLPPTPEVPRCRHPNCGGPAVDRDRVYCVEHMEAARVRRQAPPPPVDPGTPEPGEVTDEADEPAVPPPAEFPEETAPVPEASLCAWNGCSRPFERGYRFCRAHRIQYSDLRVSDRRRVDRRRITDPAEQNAEEPVRRCRWPEPCEVPVADSVGHFCPTHRPIYNNLSTADRATVLSGTLPRSIRCTYCGMPALSGMSYCAAHHRVCMNRGCENRVAGVGLCGHCVAAANMATPSNTPPCRWRGCTATRHDGSYYCAAHQAANDAWFRATLELDSPSLSTQPASRRVRRTRPEVDRAMAEAAQRARLDALHRRLRTAQSGRDGTRDSGNPAGPAGLRHRVAADDVHHLETRAFREILEPNTTAPAEAETPPAEPTS